VTSLPSTRALREREGLFLCLLSAAGFGAMPILGRQAFAAGMELTPLLALRFLLAAAMLWALIALRRRALGSLRGVALGGLLGLCGYSVQAGLYFGAIERIDVSLASLILYTYPALVTIAAFALGRERATRRKLAALALASGGVALVVGGATGTIDWLGAAMAFGCAVFYTGFILGSDRAASTTSPLAFAASVATGAALTFTVAAVASGGIHATGEGVMWVALIASISTVLPIVLFMAGLARVGPSTASIASTVEPVFTVALASTVLGETLGPVQLAGGALVIAAVVVLQLRSRARSASGLIPLTRSSLRQSSSSPPSASHAHVSPTVSASGLGVNPARVARWADIP
jgi:drug/metabolite transporter (DMT)-like permease